MTDRHPIRVLYNGPTDITVLLGDLDITNMIRGLSLHIGLNEMPQVGLSFIPEVVDVRVIDAVVEAQADLYDQDDYGRDAKPVRIKRVRDYIEGAQQRKAQSD